MKLVILKDLNIKKAICKPFLLKMIKRGRGQTPLEGSKLAQAKLPLPTPRALKPTRDQYFTVSSQGTSLRNILSDPKSFPLSEEEFVALLSPKFVVGSAKSKPTFNLPLL